MLLGEENYQEIAEILADEYSSLEYLVEDLVNYTSLSAPLARELGKTFRSKFKKKKNDVNKVLDFVVEYYSSSAQEL